MLVFLWELSGPLQQLCFEQVKQSKVVLEWDICIDYYETFDRMQDQILNKMPTWNAIFIRLDQFNVLQFIYKHKLWNKYTTLTLKESLG